VFEQNINSKKMGKMLNHIVRENKSSSDALIKIFIDIACNLEENEDFFVMFKSFDLVLLYNDSLQKRRIKVTQTQIKLICSCL
jgi:hypothetical protein